MAVNTETKYEVIIGLEIHAELLTDAKIFCGCGTTFGAEPNTLVCPICLGLPGTVPVLNRQAVAYTIQAGLALNCEIASKSRFDRKHYFYPDQPTAYQVTQDPAPICGPGHVDFELDGETRRVGIERVHLELEAGKSVHAGDRLVDAAYSLIDYNRCGIPLIEIVTEPDIRSPKEARVFLESLRAMLEYSGVSDCKMEQGSLRCDANLSLRPAGSTEFGTKVEIKNLNSFRAIQRALEYEVRRQTDLLDRGEAVVEETRHWDESRGVTVSMRTVEEDDDYRFLPEADLPPIEIDSAWIDELRAALPELPRQRQQRFVSEYDLPQYDAEVLTADRAVADYYEACVAVYDDAKTVSNWMMGEFLRLLNEDNLEVADVELTPENFGALLKLVDEKVISANVGKEVFEEMFRTGKAPGAIVEERGLQQISDEDELGAIVDEVIAANEDAADNVRAGEMRAIGFLVGQVMAKTRGQANPQLVNKLLRERLTGD